MCEYKSWLARVPAQDQRDLRDLCSPQDASLTYWYVITNWCLIGTPDNLVCQLNIKLFQQGEGSDASFVVTSGSLYKILNKTNG